MIKKNQKHKWNDEALFNWTTLFIISCGPQQIPYFCSAAPTTHDIIEVIFSKISCNIIMIEVVCRSS